VLSRQIDLRLRFAQSGDRFLSKRSKRCIGSFSIHFSTFCRPLFKGLNVSAAISYPGNAKSPQDRLLGAFTRALERAAYADFFGTRTSSKLSMLCSPVTMRAIRPEERFKTGTPANSKSLRKSA
jgi:hypothetical protein